MRDQMRGVNESSKPGFMRSKPKKSWVLAAAIGAVAIPTIAQAAQWSASPSDNTWSNSANWGGTAPASGDSLIFATSSLTSLSDNLMTAGTYNVAGITFNSGASAFTINPATVGTN